jgi:2-oxoacid:acceptor oxidoreductase delta subunit (pyruvate/2-ketoisovalerate family)
VIEANDFKIGPHLKTPIWGSKTSSWRFLKPILLEEKCNGCLMCWLFCPEGCFIRQEDSNSKSSSLELKLDFCKGCGICAEECPRQAIKMVEETE